MTPLDAVAYVADAWVLITYAILARVGRVRPFHWANAIGCVPVLATEIAAHVWPPMILTAAFGAIGVAGVIRGEP